MASEVYSTGKKDKKSTQKKKKKKKTKKTQKKKKKKKNLGKMDLKMVIGGVRKVRASPKRT